jgi:predicted permease
MRDLRYAVRILIKSPAFAIASILTLALCIGANTAIFTVVDRVLLRALPYPRSDRLAQVVVHRDRSGEDDSGQTGATWELLRDAIRTGDVAAVTGLGMGVNLVWREQPQYVKLQSVSAGFFRVLGVAPALGREFTLDEDRVDGPAAAVLSHELWTHLGADASIVGRSVTLRGEPHLVVGVMPRGFTSGSPVDVWTPARAWRRGEGGGNNYGIIARLRPDVTWAQADAEFASVGQPAMDDMFRSPENRSRLHLIPLQRGETEAVREPLMVLWAAVGAVLLIGCVNIAGLLMARGVARGPEMATRLALGGGRATIVRQLLTESLVLAGCGGALGLLLGYAGSRVFATLLHDAFGLEGDVGLDTRVFVLTSAAALLTSLVFGLVPALQASRVNLRAALVDAGSPSIAGDAKGWPRRAMVGIEVALGVVLLVGAGLLIRTFDHLVRLPPGFDGTHVMTATLSLQDARYATVDRVSQLFDRTLARMKATPGVENAAIALTLPYERALNVGFRFPGEKDNRTINLTYVTPGYFDTLRVPLRRGRVFTDADAADSQPVIIVNEAFARRHLKDTDPIGRVVQSNGNRTIVGVVGDIQTRTAFGNFGPVGAAPAAYIPAAQTNAGLLRTVHAWFSPSWFVRAAGEPRGMVADMQRAVQSVDPLLPFSKFRTLDDVRGEAIASERAQTLMLGALAALALVLAAIGVYGLVTNSIAERTRELGVRIAIGASPSRAMRAALAPSAAVAAIGVVAGIAGAAALSRTMQHLVWGVSTSDPWTYAVATGVVAVVAAVAMLIPARRVSRMNPITALRGVR